MFILAFSSDLSFSVNCHSNRSFLDFRDPVVFSSAAVLYYIGNPMHFSCWFPAIAVNYSTSVFKLIRLIVILDEAVYNAPGSLYLDKTPHSIPKPVYVDKAPRNMPQSLHVHEPLHNMPAHMSADKAHNKMPESLRVDETTHNIPGSLYMDQTTRNISESLHMDKTTYNIPGSLHIDKTIHNIPGSLLIGRTFLYVDKTLRKTPGSTWDKAPQHLPGSVHDYSLGGINTNSKIAIISNRPHSNHPRTEQVKLNFRITTRRVRLKTLMAGKLSWNGQTIYDGYKRLIIIKENSAFRSLPFVTSDVTRRARPQLSYLLGVNASCLVPVVYLPELPIIVVSFLKMPEEQRLAKTASRFVSAGKALLPSALRPMSDTSVGNEGRRELDDGYQGSGRATGRKLQLVVLNAVWADWTGWSACSSVCGKSGFSVRKRLCKTSPDVPCEEGMSFDMRECIPGIKCEAKFSDWGGWGPCSATCGKGVRARSRVCVTEDQGLKCSGMSSLLERCRMPKCVPKKHTEDVPAPPPAVAASSDVPAFLKGKRLVAQKFYMFPARLVKRVDFTSTMSPAQSFLWGDQQPFDMGRQSEYQEPLDEGEQSLLRVEKFLNIKIPLPPMRPQPKYESRRTSPVNPYIWGAWGEWSVCSSKCGDGKRVRQLFCLDHSQELDVRVKLKWCGQGGYSQTLHCLGSCSPVQGAEGDESSSKLKIIESAGNGGPHVKYHLTFEEEMNIDRAELVQSGNRQGPDVVYTKDNDKSGPLSRVEVEETGGKAGPVVRTEHELETNANATRESKENEELRLTVETYLFIVLFLICIVLIIIAFCIYFIQRTIDANKRKEMKVTSPFYKPDVGADEDEEVPLGGVIKTVYKSARLPQGFQAKKKALRTAKSAIKRRKLKAGRNLGSTNRFRPMASQSSPGSRTVNEQQIFNP